MPNLFEYFRGAAYFDAIKVVQAERYAKLYEVFSCRKHYLSPQNDKATFMPYKIVLSLYLLFFLLIPCSAQRPKIGLALGGGGAKGAAEVGVLKVLEEEGVPIDYISGTSIGAIVGGLYSVGYRADHLRRLFHSADWNTLLSDRRAGRSRTLFSQQSEESYIFTTPIPFIHRKKAGDRSSVSMSKGLVDGQNLENFFSALTVGYHDVADFHHLPIPFTCVATDLVSGTESRLCSGSLSRAMRASMSIPGMFEPVDWGDSLLVDGGTINNFPVDVVRDMGADIVIGVDLSQSQHRSKEELRGLSAVLQGLINTMGKSSYAANRERVDLYVHPDLTGYGAMSFSQSATDSMYLRGYAAADRLRPQLRRLAALCAADSLSRLSPSVAAPSLDSLTSSASHYSIGPILFDGTSEGDRQWLLSQLKIREQSIVSGSDIDAALDALRGMGIFSSVTWSLSATPPYTLTFHAIPVKNETVGVGARFDSQDLASVLVGISNMPVFATRHHYSLTGRISTNPYVDLEYHYGNLFGPRAGVEYRYRYSDFDRFGTHGKQEALAFHTHSVSAFFLQLFTRCRLQAGLRLDFYHFSRNLSHDADAVPLSDSKHYLNWFLHYTWDTLDRHYFPTSGLRVMARATLYTTNGITYRHKTPFYALQASASTAFRLKDSLYLLPSVQGRMLFGSNSQRIYGNYVGGNYDAIYLPQQCAMPTVLRLHALDDKFASTRLTFRYRVKDNIYFSATGEVGKTSDTLKDFFRGNTLWGTSLEASYDFMLGPVSLSAMYSSLYRRFGFYASAGFYF